MTQAQDAVLHPGRLVIIRRQVVVGQEGPSPKGTESGSEPLDLDVLSHPLMHELPCPRQGLQPSPQHRCSRSGIRMCLAWGILRTLPPPVSLGTSAACQWQKERRFESLCQLPETH